jgi:peptidoglycan/LPS O-acetylase OafA/YrhL
LCGLVVAAPLFRAHETTRAQYVLLHCRADALAIGILIAILVRHAAAWRWIARNRSGLNLVLAVGAVVMAWLTIYFLRHEDSALGYSLVGLFYGCCLLKAVVQPEGLMGRILRNRIMLRIGRLSFFFYVVHQAVLTVLWATVLGNRNLDASPAAGFALTVAAIAVMWGVAELSGRYFEGPLIKRAHTEYSY